MIENLVFSGGFLVVLWALAQVEERSIRAQQRRRWMERPR
jgi:hypothetical protein